MKSTQPKTLSPEARKVLFAMESLFQSRAPIIPPNGTDDSEQQAAIKAFNASPFMVLANEIIDKITVLDRMDDLGQASVKS